MRDQRSLSSFHRDIGIPINFQEESVLLTFCSIELHEPLQVSRDMMPPVQMRGELGFSLGYPQRIQTSLHLER